MILGYNSSVITVIQKCYGLDEINLNANQQNDKYILMLKYHTAVEMNHL